MAEVTWVARISSDGLIEGSGFLVRPDTVITCEHVVRQHQEWTVEILDGPTPHRRTGTVTAAFADPDIAVLRLDTPVPTKPAQLAPFHALRTGNPEPLLAFGFPRGFDEGRHSAEFKAILSRTASGWLTEVRMVDSTGQALVDGFSGAAAFRPQDQRVVGMIAEAHPATHSGKMVPVEVLCTHVPELVDLIGLGPAFRPPAYAGLVRLLGSRRPEHSLLSGITECRPRTELTTALAQIEFLATEHDRPHEIPDKVQDAMSRAAREMTDLRPGIDAWLDEWVPRGARTPDPPQPPPGGDDNEGMNIDPPLVLVKVDRSGSPGRKFRVDAWAMFGSTCLPVHVPPEKDRSSRLETVVASYVEAGIELIPMSAGMWPVLEFALNPAMLLKEDVDRWSLAARKTPMGWRYPVVVRELSRLERPPRNLLEQWAALHQDRTFGRPLLHWLNCTEAGDDLVVANSVVRTSLPRGKALHTRPSLGVLTAAINEGAALMIWTRWDCKSPEHSPECQGGKFAVGIQRHLDTLDPVEVLDKLRETIKDLRAESVNPEDEHPDCGRDIVVLWDDPTRRPPLDQTMVG